MLIDIAKYVRQLLPPNKRLDNHLAIITTLFAPLDWAINRQNDFEYFAQFLPQGGQVGVMEFVLQNYVNPNIRILDADGVRLDFRVMVPASLSGSELGQVRQLVERLRPASKRYEIADAPNWSNEGAVSTKLAWVVAPEVVSGTEIRFKINQTGPYPIRIYRIDQQQVYVDDVSEFPANFTPHFLLPEAGIWRVEVGSLSATVDLTPVVINPFAPDWLESLWISFSTNYRDCSLWVDTLDDVDTELKIESLDGSVVTGWTWGDVPFSSAFYIPGTTMWANGHSEVFRLNPQGGGMGGLQPSTDYRIYIRRTAAPNEVFTMVITTPSTTVDPAASISLPSSVNGEACKRAPTVYSIIAATAAHVAFYFDADNVTLLKTHLKVASTGTIIRTGLVTPADNHPTWTFTTPVTPGEYKLGLEGGNCSSAIDWSDTFEIEEEDDVDPGDLDPQSGDWEVRQQIIPFPGHMKLVRVATANGWDYTDSVTKAGLGVPSDHHGWYVINGKRVVTDRLVDYPVDIPIQAISIRKSFQKPTITDWWQVEVTLGGDYAQQYFMQPGNAYSAMAVDLFIKQ